MSHFDVCLWATCTNGDLKTFWHASTQHSALQCAEAGLANRETEYTEVNNTIIKYLRNMLKRISYEYPIDLII